MTDQVMTSRSSRFSWPAGAILRLHSARIGEQQLLLVAGCSPHSLSIYDGSNSAEPKLLTKLDLGPVSDVLVHNEWCYACSADKGVVAIDLSKPEVAKVVHEWGAELPALPCSIGILAPNDTSTSHRLAVALRALPTETTEELLIEGHASSAWEGPPADSARAVETEGDLGLPVVEHRFGDEECGFFQVGYRAYPKLNQLRFVGYHQPWEVATMGSHAFVAAGRSGLFFYDLSRLHLKEPGLEHCPGPRVRGIKAAGRHIIVTGDGELPKGEKASGVIILDYSNTALPTPVYPWKVDGLQQAVRSQLFADGLLVLEPKALCFYYLPDFALPRLAIRHSFNVKVTDIATLGECIYVASEEGKIMKLRIKLSEYVGATPSVELLGTISAEE